MTRPIRLLALLAAIAAALALATSAGASYQDVIRDCADDGQFSRQWPHGDLDKAYHNLPTDIREYTDCKSLIEAALAKGGGGPGSTAGAGGGIPGGAATTASGAAGTPAAVAALKDATANAGRSKPSTEVNGENLTPAASGLNDVPGAANALPSSLLAAIVAVIVLCALAGIAATWRHWPALARAPLRLFRR